MAAETKDRIIETTSELFRRQGFAATGVKQIVEEAKAPFGSVYHFFPEGKEQLGVEVITWSGGLYGRLLDAFFTPESEPIQATRDFFAAAAETLVQTDYADACPIATIALEVSSSSEPMRKACADAFDGWINIATPRFTGYGLTEADARKVAISLISLLEGAFVLCRAQRTTEHLQVAGDAAAAMMERAIVVSK